MSQTAHWQFRDNTNLFETFANPGSDQCEDTDNIELVEDESAALVLSFDGLSDTTPQWTVAGSLMLLPTADFNGSSDALIAYNAAGSTKQAITNFITGTHFTIHIPFVVHSFGTNNADPFANDSIIADALQFFGIYLKSTGVVGIYNWDGNADTAEVSISTNTRYVLEAIHNGSGGALSISVNAGTPASTTSGTTSNLTGALIIAANGDAVDGSGSAFADIEIGDIKIWNDADDHSTELAQLIEDYVTGGEAPAAQDIISWYSVD
jgi:hypothetical protein